MNLATYAAEFDRCAQWIEPAVQMFAHGCYDITHVREWVLAGQMMLWPGKRSAIVTELNQYPLKRVCNVAYGGGDIDELRAMQADIEAYASKQGCDLITINGRPGWARALGTGRISHTVSVKDL